MLKSIWTSLGERLRFLLAGSVEPPVPALPKPPAAPIIDCAFVEVVAEQPCAPAADETAEATAVVRAATTVPRLVDISAEVVLPVATDIGEPGERAIIATIAGSAALGAVEEPMREPDDFLLARRLQSVARLNRPIRLASPSHVYGRSAPGGRLKRVRQGCLSPVQARGRRAAFHTPAALAA